MNIIILMAYIQGISFQVATKIVESLGDDVFEYIDIANLEERLLSIRGVGKQRAYAIMEFIKTGAEEGELFCFLSVYRISSTVIMELTGEKERISAEAIKKNPYLLMDYDVPFSTCDVIGNDYGMDPWNLHRMNAIIQDILQKMKARGDTRMRYEDFLLEAKGYHTYNGSYQSGVPSVLFDVLLHSMDLVKVYESYQIKYITLSQLHHQERAIAQNTMRI